MELVCCGVKMGTLMIFSNTKGLHHGLVMMKAEHVKYLAEPLAYRIN